LYLRNPALTATVEIKDRAGPFSLRASTGKRAMAGTTDKVKGAVKEGAGKVTGDKRTEAEGKTDQAKGDVKDAARSTKESAKGVRDSLKKE
jgi:uncharacterized protein YjbJ (UPF0337 family)